MQIPPMFAEAELNHKTEATRILSDWWTGKQDRGDIFRSLHGSTGTGKTYACRAYQKVTSAVYYKASELYRDLLSDDPDRKDRAQVNPREATVLIIDELGREPGTESKWFERWVDDLADYRMENYRKMVIATNLNIAEFKERYGERVASRIAGNGEAYELEPIDLRRKNLAEKKGMLKEEK